MRRQKDFQWMDILVIFTFLTAMGWATSESWAAEVKYPNKPIQVVIGFNPGGTDASLRPLVDKLPEYLGQPMVFVFRPGASGSVGASFVARTKPDGYTLLGTNPSPLLIFPHTKEGGGVGYTVDDFVPIVRFSGFSFALAVRADSPWKTLKDVVEEAKKSPGKLTYSTSGVFGNTHLLMETFFKSSGISMTHVPCAGVSPALTALLGGHVDICPSMVTPFLPHIKSGTIRAIAVFEKERLKELPNVPTFSESGYSIVFFPLWVGLLAPKGTPEEVLKTIYTASKKAITDHKDFINDQLESMSMKLVFLGPEEFARELKAENEAMKKIIGDLMKGMK